jgi:hypothetical protein
VFGTRVAQARARLVQLSNARTYHRDKNGKFTSGGGGSGGVRKALKDAKTLDDIASATSRELSSVQGHPVAVNFTGLHPQVAREYGEGLIQAAGHFPGSRLGAVGTYGPGGSDPGFRSERSTPNGRVILATTDHGPVDGNHDRIMFNAANGSQEGRLRDALKESAAAHDTVGGSIPYVAIHEFAHVAAGAGNAEWQVHGHYAQQAERHHQPMSEYVASHLSKYAATNHMELSAEAVSDVIMHGHKAKLDSMFAYVRIHYEFQDTGHAETFDRLPGFGVRAAQTRGRVLVEPVARTYKRDSDGQFSSTGGGGESAEDGEEDEYGGYTENGKYYNSDSEHIESDYLAEHGRPITYNAFGDLATNSHEVILSERSGIQIVHLRRNKDGEEVVESAGVRISGMSAKDARDLADHVGWAMEADRGETVTHEASGLTVNARGNGGVTLVGMGKNGKDIRLRDGEAVDMEGALTSIAAASDRHSTKGGSA